MSVIIISWRVLGIKVVWSGFYFKKDHSGYLLEKDGQKHQKLKIRAATVKFMPQPAPNQSRLTGEMVRPDPDVGYDDDDQFWS